MSTGGMIGGRSATPSYGLVLRGSVKRSVITLPIESEWPGNLTSITLSGTGGSATLDGRNDHPMAILRDLRPDQETVMKVGRTFLSARIDTDDVSAQMRLCSLSPKAIAQTGDSSTAFRVTCLAITIGEMYPSHVRRHCLPEEAARPTKDLLRHEIIPVRLARVHS